MNHKRTIIALAAIMLAIIPLGVVMSGGSDAAVDINDIWGEGFTNTHDGTLHVLLRNTDVNPHVITITVTEDGRELASTVVTVPAEGTFTADLRFRLEGLGDHDITVTCLPAILFPTPPDSSPINYDNVVIKVTESVWSKPSTYGAIVVVVILILIAVYLKMRNAPATKPEMTFTELEKQQKESRADTGEKPKISATEKRRYKESDSSSKAAAKTPALPEKKAASFTELEKEKNKKEKAAPKKEPPSEEPKKLKYISSRRK